MERSKKTHPKEIFIREITSKIANVYEPDDDDDEKFLVLFDELHSFLKGGVMTEGCVKALSAYFDNTEIFWQSLWDDYENS